jgi:hypothetical protein
MKSSGCANDAARFDEHVMEIVFVIEESAPRWSPRIMAYGDMDHPQRDLNSLEESTQRNG